MIRIVFARPALFRLNDLRRGHNYLIDRYVVIGAVSSIFLKVRNKKKITRKLRARSDPILQLDRSSRTLRRYCRFVRRRDRLSRSLRDRRVRRRALRSSWAATAATTLVTTPVAAPIAAVINITVVSTSVSE